ncbi:MAG TPA: rod-binding protein [Syntrophales bacterium]|nr:rod-binding protein [Syntrophales bacterium]
MEEIRHIPPLATQNLARMSARADAASAEEEEKDRKLRKSCADFEALFISYIFQTMRKTVPESTLTTRMPGKDTYTMIMDHKLSEDLARRGGIGLQKVLYEQLRQPRSTVKPGETPGAEPPDAAAKKTLKTD